MREGLTFRDGAGAVTRSFPVSLRAPGGVVIDVANVFAVDIGTGLYRIAREDGTVAVLDANGGASGPIARTASFVYFAYRGANGSGIRRVVK